MWPMKKKNKNSDAPEVSLEKLRLQEQNENSVGLDSEESGTKNHKTQRKKYDLSSEESNYLLREVFKVRDPEQEARERLLKVLGKLLSEPENASSGRDEDLFRKKQNLEE